MKGFATGVSPAGGSVRRRTAAPLLLASLFLAGPLEAAPETTRWRVTIAARLVPANGQPLSARVAIAPDLPGQQVGNVAVSARGLTATVKADDPHPHVLFEGTTRHPVRVGVSFDVERRNEPLPAARFIPVEFPTSALLPFVSPAPLFQSRSILIRDFLESHAGPRIQPPQVGLVDAILAATRGEIKQRRDGKSLALDVIRRCRGKRIGIERVFTTALRCAAIPARFVEGADLAVDTQRKRRFWNLLHSDGKWIPLSASAAWQGEQPASLVALALDGTRVVHGAAGTQISYTLQARKVSP